MARRTNRMMQQGMPIQMHDKKAEMDAATSYIPRKSSRNGALVFGIATFVLVFIVVVVLWAFVFGRVGIYALVAAALLALVALSAFWKARASGGPWTIFHHSNNRTRHNPH